MAACEIVQAVGYAHFDVGYTWNSFKINSRM